MHALLFSGMKAAQDHDCNFAANRLAVRFMPDVLTIIAASGVMIHFEGAAPNIDEKRRVLNAAQQEAALGFNQTLRAIIPKAALIATHSTSVASAPIALAAENLLVLDADEKARLLQPLSDLSSEIQSNVTATYFNSAAISAGLEVPFEQAVDATLGILVEEYGAPPFGQSFKRQASCSGTSSSDIWVSAIDRRAGCAAFPGSDAPSRKLLR